MNKEDLRVFIFEKAGFCGCGDPASALKLLKDVLTVLRDRFENNGEDFEKTKAKMEKLLGSWDGGIFYWFMYYLNDKGLAEHGGSVGGSWLTNLGKEILEDLDAFGTDFIGEDF